MTRTVQLGEVMCKSVKDSECFHYLTEHRGTKNQKFIIQIYRAITITASLAVTPNIHIEFTLISS
jgi:hypothetical protein